MKNPETPALCVVWFRDDLRVADHPALHAALSVPGAAVLAVYVLDEVSPGVRPLGAAAKWWLHHGLMDLSDELADLGIPLILRQGPGPRVLEDVVQELGQGLTVPPSSVSVFWNRRYGGGEREVDTTTKSILRGRGHSVTSFGANLLQEPWEVQTLDGNPYKVFTPFFNALQKLPLRPELPRPLGTKIKVMPSDLPLSDELASWELLPQQPDWSVGLGATWVPGEKSAHQRLAQVLDQVIQDYEQARDTPGIDGTSRLSPALRWGHLSPVQVWYALQEMTGDDPQVRQGANALVRQLAWRDFCWNQLFYSPNMHEQNLRLEFDRMDWAWPTTNLPKPGESIHPGADGTARDGNGLQKQVDQHYLSWCRGQTGFGLVDAGMTQLWRTGWMHNRVRMVVASFLVKNLGIDWRVGEAWFWDTLVDADTASNPANWQWVAGSGADAAPYFRVFNPELQARKFDPQGTYQTEFGWFSGGVPLIDLKESRTAALEAYRVMKESSTPSTD